MAIKALFFDVGNTLLFPNRQRMLRSLDALVESHVAVDHGFWHIYYTHLLEELGIPDENICSDLVACTRISENWRDIRPGTRETLLRLAKRYRLGVISNADGKINDILGHC